MYRTHNCGELRLTDVGQNVMLSGWIQKIRNLGAMTFIDLRDRYGLTQLVVDDKSDASLHDIVSGLGREFVVKVDGAVIERSSKNSKILTGEVEVRVEGITILNSSETPPFTIEDETDGGDELRMKYRYLDLRRNPVKEALMLRHKMAQEVRKYLDSKDFIEVETPVLIKSTPEGARDFVVPSRMNPGEFYALPQSPQTFKQLLMVAGFDKYFQIVKCFRDEDLRADRQPEFTSTFEGLTKHLFKFVKGIDITESFQRLSYQDAMTSYGSDKPDLRFGMQFVDLTDSIKGKGFIVFDDAEYIGGICATGCASYSRKQIDELTEFVKKPQIGGKGLVYIRMEEDGSIKSSVDKFYSPEDRLAIASKMDAKKGDLILLMSGDRKKTLTALCELRLEMGSRLNLRDKNKFVPLWVVDFPLLEWDEKVNRFFAMHHPFTSPNPEDVVLFDTNPGAIRANAYDLVINGVEIGGGSIRIHDKQLQQKMFEVLGFTPEDAEAQFGFLMTAFKFGAPPHGGIAFGFDRLCSLFGGADSIRDYIAFPKNNSGRDVMINSPAPISSEQLKELSIDLKKV